MNDFLLNKLKEHFFELADEISIGECELRNYSVNTFQDKSYPRDCYEHLEDAMDEKTARGEGFTIGASFKGGGSSGLISFTSDFGFVISDTDVIKILLSD